MRRIYFVRERDEDCGIAIVADSLSQAKKIAYGSLDISCDWIDMRVTVVKGFDNNDLPLGIVGSSRGLELGIYGHVQDMKCPVCGQISTVYNDSDVIACNICLEELL